VGRGSPGCPWVRGQGFKLTGSTALCGTSGLSRPITRTTGIEEGLPMSDPLRLFPRQPSLRHFKLEAKRRLAAGEFATLHDAQLAIAREHGLSSWTVLKQLVDRQPAAPHPPLDQVRWLIERFAGADDPGWAAPAEDELQEHFAENFLTAVPAAQLVAAITGQAGVLREELRVTAETPQHLQAQIGGLQIEAASEPGPPHRLAMLRVYPIGRRVADPRVAAPSSRTEGDVPPAAREAADRALAELGLPGLVLAGVGPDGAGPGAAWATRPTTTCGQSSSRTGRSPSGIGFGTPAAWTARPSCSPAPCRSCGR
jgi:hypothetical protein